LQSARPSCDLQREHRDQRGSKPALRRRISWARGCTPTVKASARPGIAFSRGTRGDLEPRFIAQGDHVAVQWRHKAENSETGQRIDLPAVSIYRLLDGNIVDSRMFHFDTVALLKFLQVSSPK
jgi:hypothetical protein